MRIHRPFAIWALLIGAAAPSLAGCHAGPPLVPQAGGATPSLSQTRSSSSAAVAKVTILIPNAKPSRAAGLLHQQFISASTKGVSAIVYVHGAGGKPVARSVADVSPGSPSCTNAPGGRTCTVAVNAPVGTDDFVVECYDQPPSGKAIPAGAKRLGYGVATQAIVQSGENAIKVAVGGVVASTFLYLNLLKIAAIDPSMQTASAGARDADGNVILTDAYVDTNGKPVTITMLADRFGASTVSFTPQSFGAPLAAITVKYDPSKTTGGQLKGGFTTSLSARPSNGAGIGRTNLTLQYISIDNYPAPVANANPQGIVAGADGAMWFAEAGAGGIGRIPTTASPVAHSWHVPTKNSQPAGVALGPDGNVWFSEHCAGKIGQISAAGVITEYPLPSATADPFGIAAGPDGAMWFTETVSDKIGRLTTNGVLTEFAVPTANAFPAQIVAGTDGALWFTETTGNKIGRMTTSGDVVEYSVPHAATGPLGITSGPDGAIWFAEYAGNRIGRVANDTVTEYTLPSSDKPYGIAPGPDGALWFGEANAGGRIGRITTAGVVSEFYVAPNIVSAYPQTGPDGALWFTENGANSIGRIR